MIICVDLDGTLIKTDMLYESALLLIKKNPLYLFLIFFWLIQGRAKAKREIASRISISPETLPYHHELLSWLKAQKENQKQTQKTQLILVTATDELLADSIAAHLQIFDEVYGSDGVINLKGPAKRDFLDTKYGQGKYNYIGDSSADLAIWEHAEACGMVSAKPRLISQVKALNKPIIFQLSGQKTLPTDQLFVETLNTDSSIPPGETDFAAEGEGKIREGKLNQPSTTIGSSSGSPSLVSSGLTATKPVSPSRGETDQSSRLLASSISHPKTLNSSFNKVKIWAKALRVHQYAKNGLIFLPWILAHDFFNLSGFLSLVLGFICFSLLASSVYVLNDLLDLTADRKHPRKCKRAFASGDISLPLGFLAGGICLTLSIVLACFLPWEFGLVLFIYYAITLAYSFYLKSQALIDVYTLAVLYTLRIFAGMAILQAGYSSWLVLFSFFIFTSLAFVKRFTELFQLAKKSSQQPSSENPETLHGRGYQLENLLLVKIFGICSGFLSILIFGLYLNSFKANTLYHSPQILYAVCPVLLYWISRIWLKASQGQVHDDPVIFALKDRTTYCLVGIIFIIAVIASI